MTGTGKGLAVRQDVAGLHHLRNSRRPPRHVVEIGHDGWRQFVILIGKSVHQLLKPSGQLGRVGPQHGLQPLADLVADRAAVQAVDLQLV